jgi:hypothetical protein
MLLVTKSLQYLRAAASDCYPSMNTCACGTAHDAYSSRYINLRQAEEDQWAMGKFNDCSSFQVTPEADNSSDPDTDQQLEDVTSVNHSRSNGRISMS